MFHIKLCDEFGRVEFNRLVKANSKEEAIKNLNELNNSWIIECTEVTFDNEGIIYLD